MFFLSQLSIALSISALVAITYQGLAIMLRRNTHSPKKIRAISARKRYEGCCVTGKNPKRVFMGRRNAKNPKNIRINASVLPKKVGGVPSASRVARASSGVPQNNR